NGSKNRNLINEEAPDHDEGEPLFKACGNYGCDFFFRFSNLVKNVAFSQGVSQSLAVFSIRGENYASNLQFSTICLKIPQSQLIFQQSVQKIPQSQLIFSDPLENSAISLRTSAILPGNSAIYAIS